MEYRAGEGEAENFRTPRYFCISGQWYLSSRENLQMGPFPSLDDAQMELLMFLRHVDEGGIYANGYLQRHSVEISGFF